LNKKQVTLAPVCQAGNGWFSSLTFVLGHLELNSVVAPNIRCSGRAEAVLLAFVRHSRRATEHFR